MTDIKKVAIFDSRIIQPSPKYKIQKSALSVTNTKVQSLTSSSSVVNWNIQVPSKNVFMDRKVPFTGDIVLKCTYNSSLSGVAAAGLDGNPAANTPLNCGLAQFLSANSFPLHRLIQTASVTINDTVSTINMADVLNELLMLNEYRADKKSNQTCPAFLSQYAQHKDSKGAINNGLSGFYDKKYSTPPNGAWGDIFFCDKNGNKLTGDGDATLAVANYPLVVDGKKYNFRGGIPAVMGVDFQGVGGDGGNFETVYKFFIRLKCTENLMCSPFLFNKEVGDSVGLFGVSNAQIQLNLKSPSRALQFLPEKLRAAGAEPTLTVEYHSQPWRKTELNVEFLTPSLEVKMPSTSVVPYFEYPRYVSKFNLGAGSSTQVIANTLTLPSIPDFLIICAKRGSYAPSQNEHYFPIEKINITFDNMSGILNSHTKEQLYQMSYENGLQMDYTTYSGAGSVPTKQIQSVGGFLILEFGKDIPLSSSLASGVVGNFTLQIATTVSRPSTVTDVGEITDCQLVIITPNSGFFVTQSGSSSIVKGVLSESDVLESKMTGMTEMDLQRVVGGSFLSKMSSLLTKAKDFGSKVASNPMVKQAYESYGKPIIKKQLKRIGLGRGGGSRTGVLGSGKTRLSDLM